MLKEMLSSIENSIEFPRERWKFKTAYGIVAHYGQQFEKIGKLPEGMKLGRPRKCYHNAFTRIGGDLLYTEGFMMVCGVPILHGWLTDIHTMEVIEVTLPEPAEEYYGVIFQTGYVVDLAFRTRYACVFDNNREIVEGFRLKGLPGYALFDPQKGDQ
jgi:hypothetical protein